MFSFMFDDFIRDLLGFNARTLYEKYNLSPNPLDISSFGNIFLECNICQVMISKGRRSGIILNWTITAGPDYKKVEKISGGISWYTMHSKDIISSKCFKLKKENEQMKKNHSTVKVLLFVYQSRKFKSRYIQI